MHVFIQYRVLSSGIPHSQTLPGQRERERERGTPHSKEREREAPLTVRYYQRERERGTPHVQILPKREGERERDTDNLLYYT
jgi:hypothetical protein